MITEKQVIELIQEHLRDSEKFLIEVMIKPGNHIMVFIDGDHGVTIEDCKNLSRHLEYKLDRDKEDFDLMVSSSGADKPLQVLRQYRKYVGKNLEVVTKTGSRIEATLLSADSKGIKLEQEIKKLKKEFEKKIMEINYNEIKSAKPVIKFKH